MNVQRPKWLPPLATPTEREYFKGTGGLVGQPYDLLIGLLVVALVFGAPFLLFGAPG